MVKVLLQSLWRALLCRVSSQPESCSSLRSFCFEFLGDPSPCSDQEQEREEESGRTEFWILGNMRFEPKERSGGPKQCLFGELFLVQCLIPKYALSTLVVLHPSLVHHKSWKWRKKKALQAKVVPSFSPLPHGSQSRSLPHSLLVPPALQCRASLLSLISFSNDHCRAMLW